MTLAFVLLAAIAAVLVVAFAIGLYMDRPRWISGGPDAAWLAQLDVEGGAEETADRRFRLADRLRQRAARIGRRPRP